VTAIQLHPFVSYGDTSQTGRIPDLDAMVQAVMKAKAARKDIP